MNIVLSHPTGNEFFRAAANGFFEAGDLQSVYTCLASFPGTFLYRLGSVNALHEIRRRALSSSFKSITHTYPWKEVARLVSIKTGRKKWLQHETGEFSIDRVYQSFDKYVAHKLPEEQTKGTTAIYAYEDGAASSFKKAKALGMQTIYDLPIGYWRTMHEMLSAEKELNPGWAETLEGLKNSQEKLARKDEEISLADNIIVASSFTANSLKTYPYPLPKIHIVPYGFPAVNPKKYSRIAGNEPLKLLFVGGLSQRKGLSYLFEAVRKFDKQIILTVVGRKSANFPKVLSDSLSRHTWIETLPHHKVLELMSAHDILIFPSLFEGFGQVITEAMAQGTPVITTERTAGPDIIKHNENGWIVKAGCVNAIIHILDEIIAHPAIIEHTGKNALETARQRPWSIYGKELAVAVNG